MPFASPPHMVLVLVLVLVRLWAVWQAFSARSGLVGSTVVLYPSEFLHAVEWKLAV
ncbi:predicted protein [Plenodomus lingam JN3]|uniref:Predicted protein n=1 Tax=Leptosphaeria maculans (strain JN3 / isolate v23.1.3 / race Av1-4-5-6-7-8) TaxID=985895 RepID=E5A584_LEPMJ|nr:predicted protein [Plenodomus lingam JN3]CBX98782.1 predicted protein [Plenodomus lingam JN3]